ncbi:MAG: nucleotidyltransferase [Bacilli bacterium]|nr:nucleotidyltransferase [Bacilli bacterium]
MKNKTLLILAAGMGSRYGGLKQTEKFGPSGEFIIDYSIYDAIKNGFNKVVFIIKEENYDLFRTTVGKRIEKQVDVEYVFQNLDNVPKKYKIPADRVKPLGTAHAILCAKDVINEPFVIINADDFYGEEAFELASKDLDSDVEDISIIGYKVVNTMTENGSVKRGVLNEKDGLLLGIIESVVEKKDGKIIASPLNGDKPFEITKDTNVSMNMITFYPSIFKHIEKDFIDFLENANLEKDECLIPNTVTNLINSKEADVRVINTNAKWVGVTYKEDKESVQEYINSLIEKGIYNKNLWKKRK